MGLLRVALALSVVTAHIGPLFGLHFFGGGVMSVETFFMLSGFYMALVLSGRYRGRTRAFYFNRFLRLYPVYWILLAVALLVGAFYRLVSGHALGDLSVWASGTGVGTGLLAGIANLVIVGTDWLHVLASHPAIAAANQRIVIPAIWSLGVELTFYAAAPFVLRLRLPGRWAMFAAALLLRIVIWKSTGSHWTIWIYYFSPATWVFFLGGVLSHDVMVRLQPLRWFQSHAARIGWVSVALLLVVICFYETSGWLRFQDWRYYAAVGAALPFIFAASCNSRSDAALAAWSYPIYLAHGVVAASAVPLRHFFSPQALAYVILCFTLLLCFVVLQVDKIIQKRFKRIMPATPTPVVADFTPVPAPK